MEHPELAAIVRYAELAPGLVTAGQPSEEQLVHVLNAGFRIVINLGLHTDPAYALPDERATVVAHGGQYVHIPVEFGAPQLHQLAQFSAAMEAAEGRKVFVHCRHNKRVPVFIALDRVIRQGWPREAALRELRELWVPDATWSAFIEHALSSGQNGRQSTGEA